MPGRAAGLRAMPSQAAEATRPCPKAARATASAMAKPEVMATQLVEEAAASPPWAKAGVANSDTAARVKNKNASFRIYFFLLIKYRQWVVDIILVQTPSRLRSFYKAGYLVFVSCCFS